MHTLPFVDSSSFSGWLASAFSTMLALLPALPAQDPESSAQGRTHFLGREVAATMHFAGAPWLLRETREDEENGRALHRWLAVTPGQSVCDLGCGNGYHTIPLARATGPTGTVLAVDLQPEMLQLLAMRAQKDDLANIRRVECTIDDPKLAPESCDLVLMVDVYHELSHPVRVMDHVRRALKPNGRCVLVEFRQEDGAVPIKPEHTMTKAQVVREMATHGFSLHSQTDSLPWQHAMAFVAAARTGDQIADARLEAREFVRAFVAAARGYDERFVLPFLAPIVEIQSVPRWPHNVRIELAAGTRGRIVAALSTPADTPIGTDVDEVVVRRDSDGRYLVEAVQPHTQFVREHGATRAFVAMQTATGGGDVEAQAAMVRELGFDGVAWDLKDLAAMRRACEVRNGDLLSANAVVDVATLDGDTNATAIAPVREAMAALVGGPGCLWLTLEHKGLATGDSSGDAAASRLLAIVLAEAAATGVEVAIYPHHGSWLATHEHALRLCQRDPRLGLCFNLCHFLRATDAVDPAPLLRTLAPHLMAVTVNGCDLQGTDWSTLIRPLGDGDFDLRSLLTTLDAIEFDGPVGLQGFGLAGPARAHLQQSIAAWRAANER